MNNKLLIRAVAIGAAISSSASAAITDGGDGGGGGDTGGAASIVKSFTYQPSWGTTDWGAGLFAGGAVSGTPAATLNERDKAATSATLTATARLNGKRYQLLGARAYANVENGRKAQLTAALSVGSADIWPYSSSTTLPSNLYSLAAPSYKKNFIDERIGVWVGPVPVTFQATVTGTIAANLDASLNVTRVGLTFTPSANASLYATAAIGGEVCLGALCAGASAGIYTDLDLFDVRVPTRAEVSLTPVTNGLRLGMVLRGDVTISSLDGEVGGFAEAHIGSLDYTWSTSFVSWPGTSATASLFNFNGSACLVGTCLSNPFTK